MNLNKDPESWARVHPDAFLSGSIVQARNVIEMALHDIARLAAEIENLRKALVATANHVGGIVSDNASNDFLMHVPEQARLYIDRLKHDALLSAERDSK